MRGRELSSPYTIDADTMLAFDFSGNMTGGMIAAIGFNPDLATWTPSNVFELSGTDTTTLRGRNSIRYAAASPGAMHYVIPVGQYLSPARCPYLIFVNETIPPTPPRRPLQQRPHLRGSGRNHELRLCGRRQPDFGHERAWATGRPTPIRVSVRPRHRSWRAHLGHRAQRQSARGPLWLYDLVRV